MPKALCILGMVVAVLLAALFGIDLVLRFPSGAISPGMNTVIDVGFIVCGLILGYLSWSTWREQT